MWNLLAITTTALASFATTFRDHGTIASVRAVGHSMAASLPLIPHPVLTWPSVSVITLYKQCCDPAQDDAEDLSDLVGKLLLCEILRPFAASAMINEAAKFNQRELQEFVFKEMLQTGHFAVAAATPTVPEEMQPTRSEPLPPKSQVLLTLFMMTGRIAMSLGEMINQILMMMLEFSSKQV